MQSRDDKINLINEAERIREEQEYNEMKQERDAKYYDLEALRMDEQGQMESFQHEVDYWVQEGYAAIENEDYEYFKETQKFKDEAEQRRAAAQTKFEATDAKFQVEKAAKESRDMEEATKQAMAEFERRSGERKEEFDRINGELDTAKENLKNNLEEIERLQGIVDDDPNNT